MTTFEELRPVLSDSHAYLIEALLKADMTFAGAVKRLGVGHILTVNATCGEVVINATTGEVSLSTENIDPYEPYDTGYHVWTLWPEFDTSEAEQLAATITRITGDD